ncbi:MAG: BBP7 family outer membrane beta-barrel protein [Pirellulaceae bacterium]
MRISRTVGLMAAAVCAWQLAEHKLAASDFSERMAAYNVGPATGRVAPAAHREPAPRAANPPAAPHSNPAPRSPWHEMAYGGYDAGGAMSCGPMSCGSMGCGAAGCGPGGNAGPQGYETCCGKTLWWANFELLLWWRQGRDLPPLATTDTIAGSSTSAGILPGAEILFGGRRETSQMKAGGRLDIGFWLDESQCWGIGNRFYALGRDSAHLRIDTLDNPIIAIPFFNGSADEEEALLVSFPGLFSGSLDIDGSSEVLGNDLYGRFLICRDDNSRLDFITGWSFSRINDDLLIRSSRAVTETGGNIPLGTESDVLDRFQTRNEFHGGILGLMHEANCGCWSLHTMARMSLGNMNERVIIAGSTSITVPGEDPEVLDTGLFAGESNIGEFERNEFTAITEVGVKLGYNVGEFTKLTVGYSFLYWNDVVRAGDQIDRQIDVDGGEQPRFAFDRSDFWVQGVNLGLVCEF